MKVTRVKFPKNSLFVPNEQFLAYSGPKLQKSVSGDPLRGCFFLILQHDRSQ